MQIDVSPWSILEEDVDDEGIFVGFSLAEQETAEQRQERQERNLALVRDEAWRRACLGQ